MKNLKKKHIISTSDFDLKEKAEEFDNFFKMFSKQKSSQKNAEDLLVFNYGDGFKPMKIEKLLKNR